MILRNHDRARAWRAALLAATAALAVAAFAPRPASAQGQGFVPKLAGRELADAVAEGGYAILFRHMATEQVVADQGLFDLNDCSTQRNLSAEGRRQAKLLGKAFQKLGIRVASVRTSPVCRCKETGVLAFGKVEVSEMLSLVDQLPHREKDARGKAIRAMLGEAPPPGTNSVLITHTGNLLYSFGLQARPEGIAHVFRPAEFGPAVYIGMMTPEEWATLAGIARDGS